MDFITNGIALVLCQILNFTLNILIVLLAVFELVFLFLQSLRRLSALSERVGDLVHERKSTILERLRPHAFKKTSTKEKEWDYEKFDELREEYEKTEKYYSGFTLVIQLFPLLGILGTVAGLFIAINSGQDIYDGVKFALSSTVFGIIFAVVFKVMDIFLVVRYVNPIDYNMDRFEKNYQEYKDNYNTGFGIGSEKTAEIGETHTEKLVDKEVSGTGISGEYFDTKESTGNIKTEAVSVPISPEAAPEQQTQEKTDDPAGLTQAELDEIDREYEENEMMYRR